MSFVKRICIGIVLVLMIGVGALLFFVVIPHRRATSLLRGSRLVHITRLDFDGQRRHVGCTDPVILRAASDAFARAERVYEFDATKSYDIAIGMGPAVTCRTGVYLCPEASCFVVELPQSALDGIGFFSDPLYYLVQFPSESGPRVAELFDILSGTRTGDFELGGGDSEQ
jgi:hypothetical protein